MGFQSQLGTSFYIYVVCLGVLLIYHYYMLLWVNRPEAGALDRVAGGHMGTATVILLVLLFAIWWQSYPGVEALIITIISIGGVLYVIPLIYIEWRGKSGPKEGRVGLPRYKSKDLPGTGESLPRREDLEFNDDELDRLIEEGKFREAREHVREMLQLAKEMNDAKGVDNYNKYKAVIADAAMKPAEKRDSDG